MKRYKFFALDAIGRIDRGFDKCLPDEKAAIAFATTIADAAQVEISQEGRQVARIVFRGGEAFVFGS